MLTSKVSSKGQVTLPVDVRRSLGISTGDTLSYRIEGQQVTIRKMRPFEREWHASVGATLAAEWNSPEDDEAFADLQRVVENANK